MNPAGGLPRRNTVVSEEAGKGPVLVLDGGNTFVEHASDKVGPRERARAALILEGMAKVGTAAMNVGHRDLGFGAAELRKLAAARKIPLLSANLRGADGGSPFVPHLLVERGGLKIGVIGLCAAPNAATPIPAGFTALDVVATAKAELAAVQAEGAQLTVVLLSGPQDLAKVLAQLPGVDLVFPTGDGSIQQAWQPAPTSGFVVGAGQKGKMLSRVRLGYAASRPFVDAGTAERASSELEFLGTRLTDMKKRAMIAPEGDRAALERMIEQIEKRQGDVKQKSLAAPDPSKPTLAHDFVNLGKELADDPGLLKAVEAFEKAHGKNVDGHDGHAH